MRDAKIAWLTAILSLSFVVSCAFYTYKGYYLHVPYPLNTYLTDGLFGDFIGTVSAWRQWHFNGVDFGMAYFPATYIFAQLFTAIDVLPKSAVVFDELFTAFFITYTYLNVRRADAASTIRDTVICGFMSYAFLFELATGNFEAVVFVALCTFVYAYRHGYHYVAGLALGIAISMKLFPAVFLVLYVADKRYREALYAVGCAVVFFVGPLIIYPGGVSFSAFPDFSGYFRHFGQSLKMYSDLMIMNEAGNHLGHSLLNGLRVLFGPYFPPMKYVVRPYLAFAAVAFLSISAYVVFVERVFWKRVALLVISMCLLPYTSTDYKLIHLFIPLYLLINDDGADEQRWRQLAFVGLFALLLIPKGYVYFWGDPFYTLNIVLNPIIMIVTIALIAFGNRAGWSQLWQSLRRRPSRASLAGRGAE